MTASEDDEGSVLDDPGEFDPDSLGPAPPTQSSLQESIQATEDVPDGLFRAFWASVLLLNVAVAALSLGAMFIYFRGDYETGGVALAIGAVAASGTFRYYWGVKTGRYLGDGDETVDQEDDNA